MTTLSEQEFLAKAFANRKNSSNSEGTDIWIFEEGFEAGLAYNKARVDELVSREMAERIYEELKAKGVELGNASILIIQKVLKGE